MKTAGILGVGSMLAPFKSVTAAVDQVQSVPRRPFGKTGVDVSMLSLGGMFDIEANQLMLKQALKWGVNYWDTAHVYNWGRSEKGIGKYFNKYPADRKKVFLVTKSGAWTTNGMTKDLEKSLQRMQTDYVDLFFIHGIDGTNDLKNDRMRWAEKNKAAGKIRFFGFSTHSNMEYCLLGAAKLGWIDGIMMTYNYRLMHEDNMKKAVEACAKAGIGLTAMKTQGGGQVKTNSETELQLAGRFLVKGFTDAQAKLKAVWENQQIASICSQMPNMTILMSNIAAATNRTTLSASDIDLLQQYARDTCSDYCAGCAEICESSLAAHIPIGDIMRFLMYARSYGDRENATNLFRKIPKDVRAQIAGLDYSTAEQRCPRKMTIGKLMKEAAEELTS
jgi:predicted aldo/keto reductase-like oxidoreductase